MAQARQVTVLIGIARDALPDMVRHDIPASRQIASLAEIYLGRASQRLYDTSSEPLTAPTLIAKVRALLKDLDTLYVENGITRSKENQVIALVWEMLRDALDKASQIDPL